MAGFKSDPLGYVQQITNDLRDRYKCCFDITFSSGHTIPEGMVIKDKANKSWILGQELTDLVESCGLKVNPKKTRLQTCHQKQLVTGLIVNEAVNLDRHYIRNLRAMIHAYNKYGDQAVEKFMNDYAGHAHRIVSPMNTFMSSLNGRLGFVAMVKGEDHPIVRKLRLKFEHACNRQAKLHSRPLPYSTVS